MLVFVYRSDIIKLIVHTYMCEILTDVLYCVCMYGCLTVICTANKIKSYLTRMYAYTLLKSGKKKTLQAFVVQSGLLQILVCSNAYQRVLKWLQNNL